MIANKYVKKDFITPYSGHSIHKDFFEAVKNGKFLEAYKLMAQGAFVSFRSPTHDKQTPLHVATKNNDWVCYYPIIIY